MHNLMGHMHLHSDSKPFKCLYCPSKFTLKGNLTRHMKVKHGVMERGFHSQGNIYQQTYSLRGLKTHISKLEQALYHRSTTLYHRSNVIGGD